MLPPTDPNRRALGCFYGITTVAGALAAAAIAWIILAVLEDNDLMGIGPSAAICIVFGAFFFVGIVAATIAFRAMPKYTPSWQCRSCGYNLVGLTKPACPECGCPLDPKQLENAPPGLYNFSDDENENNEEDDQPTAT